MGNLSNILALIFASGGEVYSFARLKIGVYVLSEGSKEGLFPSVFSYKFEENGLTGPYDEEFANDLDLLVNLGYLTRNDNVENYGGLNTREHTLYKLTKEGKIAGEVALDNLPEDKRNAIEKVAEKLADVENYPVSELLKLYVRKRKETC